MTYIKNIMLIINKFAVINKSFSSTLDIFSWISAIEYLI
jgi:hypothetical protein